MEINESFLGCTVQFSPLWTCKNVLPIPGTREEDEYTVIAVRADKEFTCLLQHTDTGELTTANAESLRVLRSY